MAPPPTIPSTYSILPATRADIPAITACFYAAFAEDAIVSQIDNKVDPALRIAETEAFYVRQFDQIDAGISGARIFKAVDKDGTLAGYCKWIFPITLTPSQIAQREAMDAAAKAARPPPPGTNVSLLEDFFGQLAAGRKAHCNPETDYFTHILCVNPSHHRQGLGSRLLNEVLEKADREGSKTYIEASKMGLPLYVKHGWVEVGELAVDLGKHGCEGGVIRQKQLIREPKKSVA